MDVSERLIAIQCDCARLNSVATALWRHWNDNLIIRQIYQCVVGRRAKSMTAKSMPINVQFAVKSTDFQCNRATRTEEKVHAFYTNMNPRKPENFLSYFSTVAHAMETPMRQEVPGPNFSSLAQSRIRWNCQSNFVFVDRVLLIFNKLLKFKPEYLCEFTTVWIPLNRW